VILYLQAIIFIQGANEKRPFKTQWLFKSMMNLILLGNGKIEFPLGASYFAKGEPIDFESKNTNSRLLSVSKNKDRLL
jgi:hypothetical protein